MVLFVSLSNADCTARSKASVSAKCYTVLICPRQLEESNKKGCITLSETEKKYVCLIEINFDFIRAVSSKCYEFF